MVRGVSCGWDYFPIQMGTDQDPQEKPVSVSDALQSLTSRENSLSVLALSVTQLRHERCCSCLFHCQWVVEDHRIFLNFEISKSLIFFWGERVTKGFDQPHGKIYIAHGPG